MRNKLALALMSAALLSIAARAATLDTFNFSGNDVAAHNTYRISFSLDPATYTNSGDFLYTDVQGTVDGVADVLQIDVSNVFSTSVAVTDANGLFQLFSFNDTIFSGDPATGLPPSVALGSFTGMNFTSCKLSATLQNKYVGLFPTVAFFQVPTITTNCEDPATLSITSPDSTSPAPEPSTLALLGSGALGVVGFLRRRFLS